MHSYHEGLPGYNAAQLLHDGCDECEARAKKDSHGITELDIPNFRRAWLRAAEWNRDGLSNVSEAEAPMLNTLWAVQVQLERMGVPIGWVPR